MLKAGLASVTLKTKTPEEVIRLVADSDISAIEWASHVHAHEGDVALCKQILTMTHDAGLEVSSYGSYFRLGTGTDIVPFLESAAALETNQIRIWGGRESSCDLSPAQRKALVEESVAIAEKAASYNITLSLECHPNTVTDTLESQLLFLNEVNMPNFCTYWQADTALPMDARTTSLQSVYASGKLTNLHLYWYNAAHERRLLEEGKEQLTQWLSLFKNDSLPRYALIEFVKDNTDENFLRDAKTLASIVSTVNTL